MSKKKKSVSEEVLSARYGEKRPRGALAVEKRVGLSEERRASVLDARYGKAWRPAEVETPEDGKDAKVKTPEDGKDAKLKTPEDGKDANVQTRKAKKAGGKKGE